LSKKAVSLKFGELSSDIGVLKNVEFSVGRIFEDSWTEKIGPTPFPTLRDLRSWDRKLLSRYRPFYMPDCDLCCLCTMGKCDLTRNKHGACGIDMAGQQSRIVLLAACIGASTHTAHARHMIDHLIETYGRQTQIDIGRPNVEIEAPIIRLVCGMRPKTLGDLEEALDYVESQIVGLVAATHTGQEGDNVDFESKVFHAGMLDHVAMEAADIAQISTYGFPKADPEAPLVDIGFGSIDQSKPVILIIGHNVVPSVDIMDYVNDHQLYGKLEVCGICCTAIDITRYDKKAKIVGPLSWQLRFVRSGVPDVIVVDEQCIRADILEEAKKIRAPLIATTERVCHGLQDRSNDKAESIVADIVSGKAPGALILNPELVGEVAVQLALEVAPRRGKFKTIPTSEDIVKGSQRCINCNECQRACPQNLPLVAAVAEARKGNLENFTALYDGCIGCGRCEYACRNTLPLHSYIIGASQQKIREEKSRIRVGRGGIQDTEIRRVGAPIVLGEIPGVIAFVGCSNYPNGGAEVGWMAKEFIERRYIVTSSGCSAMSIAMCKNEEGKSLYEAYPGVFDSGGLTNVGSCIANAHIAGAAIKIASIFAKRPLRANYEEISDYVLNRVGAVGVAWGAYSQKAASIAAGCWRLGIPVVVGPHSTKYRRMLLGRKDVESDWYVLNARDGESVYVGPVPEHLFYTAETKEEAMVMIAKMCMRANDTYKGRAIKLSNYIDLHRRYYGSLPEDVELFVRTVADVPITMKDEIMTILRQKNWKEKVIPDPTLLERMVKKRGD